MKELTGKVFGRLKVLYRTNDHYYPSGRHDIQYRCICECGNVIDVLGIHLRSGHTKSCGCLRREITGNNKRTHGMTNTRLYHIWKNMKSRCMYEHNDDYSLYGGRGITVCSEWLHNFQSFENWAYSNGYTDSLSLDRRNVNGNYEPSNCRWITQKAQCNNTRANVNIEFRGENHTMKEWAEITGMKYGTLQSRISRGWSFEKALTK